MAMPASSQGPAFAPAESTRVLPHLCPTSQTSSQQSESPGISSCSFQSSFDRFAPAVIKVEPLNRNLNPSASAIAIPIPAGSSSSSNMGSIVTASSIQAPTQGSMQLSLPPLRPFDPSSMLQHVWHVWQLQITDYERDGMLKRECFEGGAHYLVSKEKSFTIKAEMCPLTAAAQLSCGKSAAFEPRLVYADTGADVPMIPGMVAPLGEDDVKEAQPQIVSPRTPTSFRLRIREVSHHHNNRMFKIRLQPADPQLRESQPQLTVESIPLRAFARRFDKLRKAHDPTCPPTQKRALKAAVEGVKRQATEGEPLPAETEDATMALMGLGGGPLVKCAVPYDARRPVATEPVRPDGRLGVRAPESARPIVSCAASCAACASPCGGACTSSSSRPAEADDLVYAAYANGARTQLPFGVELVEAGGRRTLREVGVELLPWSVQACSDVVNFRVAQGHAPLLLRLPHSARADQLMSLRFMHRTPDAWAWEVMAGGSFSSTGVAEIEVVDLNGGWAVMKREGRLLSAAPRVVFENVSLSVFATADERGYSPSPLPQMALVVLHPAADAYLPKPNYHPIARKQALRLVAREAVTIEFASAHAPKGFEVTLGGFTGVAVEAEMPLPPAPAAAATHTLRARFGRGSTREFTLSFCASVAPPAPRLAPRKSPAAVEQLQMASQVAAAHAAAATATGSTSAEQTARKDEALFAMLAAMRRYEPVTQGCVEVLATLHRAVRTMSPLEGLGLPLCYEGVVALGLGVDGRDPTTLAGSGFFVHSSGLLLTCDHVVEEMDARMAAVGTAGASYCVGLGEGDAFAWTYEAQLVAHSPTPCGVLPGTPPTPRLDLAVLKLVRRRYGGDLLLPVRALPLGDSQSDLISTGQPLWVLGYGAEEGGDNGEGRRLSQQTRVCAYAGRVEDLCYGSGFVLTTADVSAGHSGGPVIDGAGRVLGWSYRNLTQKLSVVIQDVMGNTVVLPSDYAGRTHLSGSVSCGGLHSFRPINDARTLCASAMAALERSQHLAR